jgi:N-methylhydantoinase B
MTSVDPVTLELIRNGLLNAADEMKNVVIGTAYSNLWKEAGDVSCAILTIEGEVVAQGSADIPIHVGALNYTFAGLVDKIPLASMRSGDAYLHNDPYRGNNHLPDLFMVKPVFVGDEIVGFSAVHGHVTDIGGGGPGSYSSTAPDIQAEGLLIPPVRAWADGKPNQDFLDIFAANLRVPGERIGDLYAQFAGCNAGEQRLLALSSRYGAKNLKAAMAQILDHAEAAARMYIGEIPDGKYTFIDHCDGDGIEDRPIVVNCTVTVSGQEIAVDFTGSSLQTQGGMNMPLAVCAAATAYAIKSLTDPDSPANTGENRPIKLTAPKGTVCNVVYPGAVVAGNHETASRVVDAVCGALAPVFKDRAVAAGAGSTGVMCFGGLRDGEPFVCVEMHGAGEGAGQDSDGGNAHRVTIGNTGNTPVEVMEMTHPVTILEYRISDDAGGAGEFRGGCGVERRIRFDVPGWLTILLERKDHPPFGLFGGGPAAPTSAVLTKANGEIVDLPIKSRPMPVDAGDVLFLKCAGGGGYGLPESRPTAQVQADLDDGYISVDSISKHYARKAIPAPDRPDGRWVVCE